MEHDTFKPDMACACTTLNLCWHIMKHGAHASTCMLKEICCADQACCAYMHAGEPVCMQAHVAGQLEACELCWARLHAQQGQFAVKVPAGAPVTSMPCWPSCGMKAQCLIGASWAATCLVWLVLRSHSLIILSVPPTKTPEPSGVKELHRTAAEPCRTVFGMACGRA